VCVCVRTCNVMLFFVITDSQIWKNNE